MMMAKTVAALHDLLEACKKTADLAEKINHPEMGVMAAELSEVITIVLEEGT